MSLRLKDIFKYSKGYAFKSISFIDKGTKVFKTTDIKNGVLSNTDNCIDEELTYFPKEVRLLENDIVISTVGSHPDIKDSAVGQIAVVDCKTKGSLLNQNTLILRQKKERNSANFLSFYLLSINFRTYLDKIARGTANQASIKVAETLFYELNIPLLKEQTQIANYLDAKTTAIDKKVKLLQQKIKLYKAYRKNLINKAITKGLDDTVCLKNSDIDWLGEIPKNWEVRRLKDVGKAIIGIVYSPSDIVNEKEGVLVLRSSNIQNDKPSFLSNVYVNKVIPNHHLTKVGDILICSRNGSRRLIGKNIVIDDKTKDYTFGAFMTVLRSKNFRFLSYFFKSILFDFQSGVFMTSTINQLTVSTLYKLSFAYPPLEEQIQIADYLDSKTATIDKIVKNIETQIITLKELRKTLINEVVTGKVKVSA